MEDALSDGPGHQLACSLSRREECRLSIVGGLPSVGFGPLCSLWLMFPGLRNAGKRDQLWLDTTQHTAWFAGRRVAFPPEEFIVVALLASACGEPVTHAEIACCLWGESPPTGSADRIQRFIRRIRGRLRSAGFPDPVWQTEKGIVLKQTTSVAV